MAAGPGKYDDLCTKVREESGAQGVILLIINGAKGSGFSVQADLPTTLEVPDLLENIAKQIRVDVGGHA